MANEINFIGDPVNDAGKTLQFRAIRKIDGASLGGGLQPMTEAAGAPGVYSGDIPASIIVPQELLIRILDNGGTEQIGTGTLLWDGTKEVDSLSNNDLIIANHTADVAEHDETLAAIGNVPDAAAIQTAAEAALVAEDIATQADLDASEASIVVETDALALQIGALKDLSAVAVNAEVDNALAGYDAPTKAELDASEATILAAVAAQVPAPSAAVIADAVWDESTGDHVAAGSMGASQPDQDLSALATSTEAAGLAADIAAVPTAAEITTVVSTELAASDIATGADVAADIAAAQAALEIEHNVTQAAIAAIPTSPTAGAIADAVWDEDLGSHAVLPGTVAEALDGAGADVSALATSAEVAALNNLSAAEVKTQADQALTDYDGPTRAEAIADRDAVQLDIANITIPPATAIAAAVWAATGRSLDSPVWLTPAAITDLAAGVESALINEGDGNAVIDAIVQKINNDLDLPSIELAAIAGAVRTELTIELARIDAAISTRSTLDAIDVETAADDALAAYDAATAADVNAAVATIPIQDNAAIADAVWDEARADHLVVGSMGETQPHVDISALALEATVAALPAPLTAAQTKAEADQAITDAALATAADVAALPTPLTAVEVRSEADDALTAYDAATGPEVAAAQAAIQTDIAGITPTDISTLATSVEISALNDITAVEVRAEVDAALVAADVPSATGLTAAVNMLLAQITATAAPTANDVADAVWDEPQSAHVAPGSIGATQGYQDLSSFAVGLMSLMADVAALNNVSVADIKAQADQALTDYDPATTGELGLAEAAVLAAIAGLNDLSSTDFVMELANYDAVTQADLDIVVLTIGAALAARPLPDNASVDIIRKVLVNKTVTNPIDGSYTVFEDDDSTPLLTGPIFEDYTGTQPYQGKGAERRDRLT